MQDSRRPRCRKIWMPFNPVLGFLLSHCHSRRRVSDRTLGSVEGDPRTASNDRNGVRVPFSQDHTARAGTSVSLKAPLSAVQSGLISN